MHIMYLFIDGIGIGSDDTKTNPFSRYATSYLSALSDRKPQFSHNKSWYMSPTDAHMGVRGLPQSATGQTALWTGINGSQVMGHHKTGFPGPTLIRVIKEHSIIKRFLEAGKKATFLNAYSEAYRERIMAKPRLKSASTHVQLASGLDLKNLDDLENGNAIYMDISHEIMHRFFPEMQDRFPVADPFERGQQLVKIARHHDLVLHEFFITDKAGHAQDFEMARWTIVTLEAFLDGIVHSMNPKTDLLVIASDHGNIEDLSTKSHTNNKVPTFACGLHAKQVIEKVACLTDIPRWLYELSGLTIDVAGAEAEILASVAKKLDP